MSVFNFNNAKPGTYANVFDTSYLSISSDQFSNQTGVIGWCCCHCCNK